MLWQIKNASVYALFFDCGEFLCKKYINIPMHKKSLLYGGNVHQDNRKYYSDSPDVLKAQIDTLERAIQDKEEQVRTLTEQVRTLTSSLAKKDEQISKLIEKIK